ncbi:MAG: hypothetical protein M0D55_01575 [Elusimicrobiota bacterium]|nr:MAG: hypothetical protein M0D55_01575 [Elusimicrobiota bacterium]
MLTLPELLPSLPGGKPRVAILMTALLAMAAATVTYCCRASTRLDFVRSPQSSIEVLRC